MLPKIEERKGKFVGFPNSPESLDFDLNNTGNEKPKYFIIGDALGLCQYVKGLVDKKSIAPVGVSVESFKRYLQSNLIQVEGLRLEAKETSNQYQNPIEVFLSELDGDDKKKVINVSQQIQNSQFQTKIQNYNSEIDFNAFRTMVVKVDANERLNITMFVKNVVRG